MQKYENYPLLITRGTHVFPSCNATFDIGRSFSLVAIAMANEKFDGRIIVVSQTDLTLDEELADVIYHEGTLCNINTTKDNNGLLRVNITGVEHVSISNVRFIGEDESSFCYICDADEVKSIPFKNLKKEQEASENLINTLMAMPLLNSLPRPVSYRLQKEISCQDLTDFLAHYLPLKYKERQAILEEKSLERRLNLLLDFLNAQKERSEIDQEINRRVQQHAEETQKEYFLREKMKAIQEELNALSGEENDNSKILEKIENGTYPEHVKDKIKKELRRFEQLPAGSLEASMAKTYIDWLVDLPWTTTTEDNDSIENARKVLDEDHYGLEKVKKRIIEYLAVKSVTKSLKSPIICLFGPPGVGKTSLAKSIARALGRKFVKASLGGTADETDIRGHRRTYVASMPGKIIKGIKAAGYANPVFLLDEIDKMASNSHGDPASALLEVLDPEQNSLFQDNYIEETYDLSNVLFVCTANYLNHIPAALMDRLELIELNSYTEFEKLQIAKNHLIKKQCQQNGLKDNQIRFEDSGLMSIIHHYTQEAGVRELERMIASCCRKAVVELLSNPRKRKIVIDAKKVKEYLGTHIFDVTLRNKKPIVGVVTGLAYTQSGGEILPIEVNYFEGKGGIILTGNLGNIMKESATIALDYVRANAERYHIPSEMFTKNDIHIHAPEGAVPKDGPSAGVALCVAIVSALTHIAIKPNVGMTGEVNLRGQSTTIGGLKEKSLAALRSGLEKILIPRGNERNIADLPEEVKKGLQIVPIDSVDDALKEALVAYDFL